MSLNKMEWKENWIKLIIHFVDAVAHGEDFSKGNKHHEQGDLLYPKIEPWVRKILILNL